MPLFFEAQPETFMVTKTVYDDGGADYALQSGGVGVKRWIIRYDGLTLAQAALIDAHVVSAFYSEDDGSAYGFNFRDHIPGTLWSDTTGTLYTGVHYAPGGYRKGHTKTWIQSREIILERRP